MLLNGRFIPIIYESCLFEYRAIGTKSEKILTSHLTYDVNVLKVCSCTPLWSRLQQSLPRLPVEGCIVSTGYISVCICSEGFISYP